MQQIVTIQAPGIPSGNAAIPGDKHTVAAGRPAESLQQMCISTVVLFLSDL
jgi:hypothetical protein